MWLPWGCCDEISQSLLICCQTSPETMGPRASEINYRVTTKVLGISSAFSLSVRPWKRSRLPLALETRWDGRGEATYGLEFLMRGSWQGDHEEQVPGREYWKETVTHTFQVKLQSLFKSWWTAKAKQSHRGHSQPLLINWGPTQTSNTETIIFSRKVKRSDIPSLKQPRPKPHLLYKPYPLYLSYIFHLLMLTEDSSARH